NIVYYLSGLLLLIIFIGLTAGFYPAFFLSSLKPHTILSGKLSKGPGMSFVRKGLVVFQFSISVFLITSTLVIYSQLEFFRSKDLGFNKDQVILVPLKEGNLKYNFQALKNSLQQNQYILSAAGASNVPGGQFNQETIRWKPD